MAAVTSQRRGLAFLGNHLIRRLSAGGAAPTRRGLSAHASAYDKNPDEVVRPAVVPDDAIQPHSDKYWSPHPTTGVFGPGEEKATAAADPATAPADGSVLEEKVWYRPLEDVDKPQSA